MSHAILLAQLGSARNFTVLRYLQNCVFWCSGLSNCGLVHVPARPHFLNKNIINTIENKKRE